MTILDGVITGLITALILSVIGWAAKYLPRIIATADRTRGIVILIGIGGILTLALSYGVNAYLYLPVNQQTTPPPEVPTATRALPNAKPHIAMTPGLEMIGNQATVMVMFHNRGKEDVDTLTLKILLNDGKKFNESLREVPILRADINANCS